MTSGLLGLVSQERASEVAGGGEADRAGEERKIEQREGRTGPRGQHSCARNRLSTQDSF